MRKLTILGFTLVGLSLPVAARTEVSVDASNAQAILAEICSGTEISEQQIKNDTHIQTMLRHFSQFRSYFTMENYIAERRSAALCEKSQQNYFRFNQLVEEKDKIASFLNDVMTQRSPSSEVTAMISPYAPANLSYEGTAMLMVGTPSCGGWSAGSTFYVDLPCISDDPKGLLYLIAHESYHGVQATFMQQTFTPNTPAELLNNVLREGSALHIASFSKIEGGGRYTELSREQEADNTRRLEQNFELLDMAVSYLQRHPGEQAYGAANNIGLSGSYGAPFYSVGAKIIETVSTSDSQAAVVCYLEKNPLALYVRYQEVAEYSDQVPPLGRALQNYLASVPQQPECR
ncbi:DUF5700 domain-containing putative Zn-dependent protease [Kordiimonas sp.]|uniref:DUF5700 domain-containing putative Zn-dependent protease n=1 Tax=Kordiimonas sp. TaxID=1970157 RepID=UPI003A9162AF